MRLVAARGVYAVRAIGVQGRSETLSQVASRPQHAISFAPELNLLDAQDGSGIFGFALAKTTRFLERLVVPSLLARGEKDNADVIAVDDVLAKCTAAADGLIIGMGAYDQDA
jgi:hypothetical protein